MFGILEKSQGWFVTWGGVVFEQPILPSREAALNRMARLQSRYPGTSWELLKDSPRRRGGPYSYSWEEQWHDDLPQGIKPAGVIYEASRSKAKEYMRYRLEKRGVGQERIRTLLTMIDLEAV